jgi:hypothetical protein
VVYRLKFFKEVLVLLRWHWQPALLIARESRRKGLNSRLRMAKKRIAHVTASNFLEIRIIGQI